VESILPQDEIQVYVQQLAEQLRETDHLPRYLLRMIVEQCGVEFCDQILRETLEIEAQGGMMVKNGERRRTVGGVFFFLARAKMAPEVRRIVYPNPAQRKKLLKQKPKPRRNKKLDAAQRALQEQQEKLPVFVWDERLEVIQPLLDEGGVLTTVKVTLIGRPGRIEKRKDLVIAAMSHQPKNVSLPKGVPAPPETPTLYTVYIGAKQWNKVESAAANPEDALIIEGTCAFDERVQGMAVFAMNVTSKMIEAEKRQQQQQQPKEKTQHPQDGNGVLPERKLPDVVESASATAKGKVPVSSKVAPEVAQKLRDLYTSAELFRQKIATIQAKPAGQQFGLEMTQKLLNNVEGEIEALEKQYLS